MPNHSLLLFVLQRKLTFHNVSHLSFPDVPGPRVRVRLPGERRFRVVQEVVVHEEFHLENDGTPGTNEREISCEGDL